MTEGGIGMLVTCVLGAATLALAILFRPTVKTLGLVRGLSHAIALVAVSATAQGLYMTTKAVAACRTLGARCASAPDVILVEGAGESVANVAVGAVVLALIAVTSAVVRVSRG